MGAWRHWLTWPMGRLHATDELNDEYRAPAVEFGSDGIGVREEHVCNVCRIGGRNNWFVSRAAHMLPYNGEKKAIAGAKNIGSNNACH